LQEITIPWASSSPALILKETKEEAEFISFVFTEVVQPSPRGVLFGGDGSGCEAGGKKGHRDRGPFGGGEAVDFKEDSDSGSESFRDAAADPKAVNQMRLVQYAKKRPGAWHRGFC